MKRKTTLPKLCALLLLAVLWMFTAVSAVSADPTGSIRYRFAVPGAEFRLYLAGAADGQDGFLLTGDFAGYPVNPADDGAANTLAIYAARDELTPLQTAVTDEAGIAVFSSLPAGIYLLVGDPITVDRVTYTPTPVLFSLPNREEGDTLSWDLTMDGKYGEEQLPPLLDYSVLKIWQDGGAASRPKSITIDLLQDGKVADTVTLSAENNWAYTWEDLDSGFTWTVAERDIPAGYTVRIQQDGVSFIVTNTAPTTPTTPGGRLPQTGQLWWPVSIFAVLGLLCLVLGLWRRRTR